MLKKFTSVFVLLAAFLLTACGGASSTLLTRPDGAIKLQKVATEVKVNSREKDDEYLPLNAEWTRLANSELQGMLSSKKVSVANDASDKIRCRVEIVYGSRSLRYGVGFGAGAGSAEVTIELVDKAGNVRYATSTRADLKGGAFGGDMKPVVEQAIKQAVADFGSRL